MIKKIIVAIAIFTMVGIPSAFALTNLTSQPSKPIVCTIGGTVPCPAGTLDTKTRDAYTQFAKDAGYGQDECYADASFGVGISCDTGLKPPPVGGHCNGVNGGGILSPVVVQSNISSVWGLEKQFLFRSLDCFAIWGSVDDVTGGHNITSVTLTDITDNRVQQAYLAPRSTVAGDWTSTFMMSYVPGDHYTLDVQTDGIDQTISYP